MNVTITGGEMTIKLTASERKKLTASLSVLSALRQVSSGPHDGAHASLTETLNSITEKGVYAPPVEDAV